MFIPKFLTRDIAAQVSTQVLNATLLNDDRHSFGYMIKRQEGHLVILVPSMEDVREADYPNWPNYPVSPYLLHEQSVGEKSDWAYPFDEIARCKALQLWQGRNDDGQTDSNAHLLFPNDTPYWGGVKRHGLVVAFSGVQPWFDQMISGMTADMLKAVGRELFEISDDSIKERSFLS